jgi:DNA-binding FadR family transcriptional regulator
VKANSLETTFPSVMDVRREYHDFVKGSQASSRTTPAQIAWILESESLRSGWVIGRPVGSELALIERFHVSRDTLREAIRLLEARGSMVIERGRRGGLRLAEPDLEWAAAALSMYLRAHGWSRTEVTQFVEVAAPVLAELPPEHFIVQLHGRTMELLLLPDNLPPRIKLLGFRIATRLIQHYSPIPADGLRLGSEDFLCERFRCSRATFRQALRILDDLGALQVQLGRGGGYFLKRPASIGIVRQMFPLLASRQSRLQEVLPAKWALDRVKLRLALQVLRTAEPAIREQHLVAMEAALQGSSEPYRWCLLQRAIGRVAASPLIATLLWSLVAYDVRKCPPDRAWASIDSELGPVECRIVAAMALDRAGDAELELCRAQQLISELMLRTRHQ